MNFLPQVFTNPRTGQRYVGTYPTFFELLREEGWFISRSPPGRPGFLVRRKGVFMQGGLKCETHAEVFERYLTDLGWSVVRAPEGAVFDSAFREVAPLPAPLPRAVPEAPPLPVVAVAAVETTAPVTAAKKATTSQDLLAILLTHLTPEQAQFTTLLDVVDNKYLRIVVPKLNFSPIASGIFEAFLEARREERCG